MSTYYLAPSLAQLRTQINERWPDRDKGSDGWIGDAAHSARKSDHNPDYSAAGIVRALDIDKDGINVDAVVTAAINDARVAYVIWNRRIYIRGVGWQRYTGSNPHTQHVHVSIRHTAAAAKKGAWSILGNTKPTTPPKVEKPKGKRWPQVLLQSAGAHTAASHTAWVDAMAGLGFKDKKLGTALQRWLSNEKNIIGKRYYSRDIDGDFTTESIKALQRFLRDKKLYKGAIDGKRESWTVAAEIAYLNSQAKYYK